MTIDQYAFRNALGHFPTGVTVVTAHAENREPIAMTVSSFNSVSLDPPLILFSVSRTAPSLQALLEADTFGVSVLRREQSDLSGRFAGKVSDKWSDIERRTGEFGCPLIGPSLATFECTPFEIHEGGDHLIIVGRVLCFETADEGEPLIFFRGKYHRIADLAA